MKVSTIYEGYNIPVNEKTDVLRVKQLAPSHTCRVGEGGQS